MTGTQGHTVTGTQWHTVTSVVHVFKGAGERSESTNYRPICLVPIISKIFECFVNQQFLGYLEDNDWLLTDCQYGFRHSRSTGNLLFPQIPGWGSCCSTGHLKGLWQGVAYWPAPQASVIWCVIQNVIHDLCFAFQPQVEGCPWGSIFSYLFYQFWCSTGLGTWSYSLSCLH